MAQGVINIIKEWLFGPPAPQEEKICLSCETLREQLAFANYDRKILLETVVKNALGTSEQSEVVDTTELQPINTSKFNKPWRVRQQELERESRQRASQLKPEPRPDAPRVVTPESIEKLEQELGVSDAVSQEAVR